MRIPIAAPALRAPCAPIALEPSPLPSLDDAQPFCLTLGQRDRDAAATLHAWRRLTRDASPLLAPEVALLTAQLEHMERVYLFGARRKGSSALVAAMPIAQRGRTLVGVRGDHTPRVDLAGDPLALPQLWRAIAQRPGWDVLELGGVPACSPLATELPGVARASGFAVEVRPMHRSPWFLTEGIEQRIHRRFRGDMRRLERQLGGVELERVTRWDRDAMDELLRLEAAAWKATAGTAILCDARLVRHYRALARVLARRGRASIAFLRARGRRIAGQLALEDASTYYLLKVGYDPEFAHFGPGQLLVRETAADAARRGLTRYDMMGRESDWKAKWTDQTLAHVEVTVYARTPGGRARQFLRTIARPAAARAWRTVRGGLGAR